MGHKLRVFLSSTMRDLANERDAVVTAIKALNIEVANAESWTPTGATSWNKIRDELGTSHLMVLIIGERYGWIPDDGPGAADKISVTEMEYRAALEMRMPVLPFLKNLEYESPASQARKSPSEVEDARRRDRFREEVREWSRGRYSGEFDLASDLARNVSEALVNLLTDVYLRQSIASRQLGSPTPLQRVAEPRGPRYRTSALPVDLVKAVRDGKAVLFAGSGVSLAAGLPSAAAFVRLFRSRIGDDNIVDDNRAAATQFATAAADFEAVHGRDALRQQMTQLLDPPQGVVPTTAHLVATKCFRSIITTNFDRLFETAAQQSSLRWQTFVEKATAPLPNHSIVKLHGSVEQEGGLIVTETDLASIEQTKHGIWNAVQEQLEQNTVIVVGSSLRDPSIVRLFASVPATRPRYVVLSGTDQANEARLARWSLQPVHMDADGFFEALEEELSAR